MAESYDEQARTCKESADRYRAAAATAPSMQEELDFFKKYASEWDKADAHVESSRIEQDIHLREQRLRHLISQHPDLVKRIEEQAKRTA